MPVIKLAPAAEDAYDDIENWKGAYRHPEALACPFCGYAPMIVKWHGGPQRKMIMCRSDYCDVGPSVCGKTERRALDAWNTRAR